MERIKFHYDLLDGTKITAKVFDKQHSFVFKEPKQKTKFGRKRRECNSASKKLDLAIDYVMKLQGSIKSLIATCKKYLKDEISFELSVD